MTSSTKQPRFAIVGAGISGLCMAIQLKRSGIDNFTVFEKSGELGGTWAVNKYPDSGCDVPSFLYSFSFAPKPDWSQKYARQPEILAYLQSCAERFQILPNICFHTSVEKARFDNDKQQWFLDTSDGRTEAFDFFVSAVGQLNRPSIPDIEGLDKYQGIVFHSAKWHEDFDYAGKDVVVIGNGASAIQLVPEVAKTANKLTQFQRGPNWICRLNNYHYPAWAKKLFSVFPFAMKLHRFWIFCDFERRFLVFRRGKPLSWIFTRLLRRRLMWKYQEPMRSKLLPNYPAGCKRILLSDVYYKTLEQPNFELVDAPIRAIDAEGVVTDKAKYKADAIIFATGFLASELLVPMEVTGKNGKSLSDTWKESPGAYLGMMVAGFPNFFMLYGPNTNLGHNSIIFMVECQVRYILACVKAVSENRLTNIEVRDDAADDFREMVQRRLKKTVWSSNCTSWYKTADGTMINNWCATTIEYWLRTRKLNLSKFENA